MASMSALPALQLHESPPRTWKTTLFLNDETLDVSATPATPWGGAAHIIAWRQEVRINRAPAERLGPSPCSVCPRCLRGGAIHPALLPTSLARANSPGMLSPHHPPRAEKYELHPPLQ